jgi:transglutaminase-like putative cysteine protease
MRLSVRHATLYTYDMPMRFVTQSHRLTPSGSAGQTVLDWEVAADGAEFGAAFSDGAGDRITTMTVPGPVERIEILVSGLVETTDTAGVLRGHREWISPRVYLQPTHATAPTRAFSALLEGARGGVSGTDGLALAHALSAAIEEAIAYTPGATDARSTAAEALEQGAGVCQDHAHALITLARLAGLPARYVTGYLLAGSEEGRETPLEEASHAWAEIHVLRLGWVGFDAANGCCPDDRYIRLGSGRDALEAAPIRGVSRGGGSEAMDVSVEVAAQQ